MRADRKREGSIDISDLKQIPKPRLKIDDSVHSSEQIAFSKIDKEDAHAEVNFQSFLAPNSKDFREKGSTFKKKHDSNPFKEAFKFKSATFVNSYEGSP